MAGVGKPLDANHIKQSYLVGEPIYKIAARLGASEERLTRLLIEEGVAIRGRGAARAARYDQMAPEIIAFYQAGNSVEQTCAKFGCTSRVVQRIFEQNGVKARFRYPDKYAEIVSLYQEGVSELEVSLRLKVSRGVVSTALRQAGVQRRSRSEANVLRLQRMTAEERRALTAACHTPESLEKCAVSSQFVQQRIGFGEAAIREALEKAGLQPAPQTPIGPYNLDLFCLPVAVEVNGCVNHPLYQARIRKRTKYLLERGFWVVYVCMVQRFSTGRGIRFDPSVADKLVEFVEFSRRHPSSPGKHWVIWGDGEERGLASSYEDFDHRPVVRTAKDCFEFS